MDKVKEKKRHIRLKGLLIIILFLYLFITIIYSILMKPIKEINITGNYYLKDNYILDYLDIEDESILKISKKEIKNKLLELDLISDVKITKNYLGILNIKIVEEKILFYNNNTNKIVLSSGTEIDDNNYNGVPTLINIVPDTVYTEFINKLNEVDIDVLAIISEIEYSPSIVDNTTVDEKRFIFRMNDGNEVYVNTTNMEKINDYLSLYEAIINKKGDVRGCLYLDSNSDNIHFNASCDEDSIDEEDEIDEEL